MSTATPLSVRPRTTAPWPCRCSITGFRAGAINLALWSLVAWMKRPNLAILRGGRRAIQDLLRQMTRILRPTPGSACIAAALHPGYDRGVSQIQIEPDWYVVRGFLPG